MPHLQVSPALSRSVEDYLKAIYRLAQEASPVATSDIALALGLSAPSVSEMIKRLSEQGLVEHVPYRGVELTARGHRAALGMLRRHRILETYLVEKLGYTWDSVHPEAERLEHAVSDALIERMALTLGNPAFDPHGDPIPQTDGSVATMDTTPLSEVAPGEVVEVSRVMTNDPGRLRFLADSGLRPGRRVVIADRQPFKGPITLHIRGREQVIGHELAALVFCRPTEEAIA